MKSPSWSSISPSQVLRKMDCPYQYVISPARGSAITNKESPNLVVGDKNLPILKICTKRNWKFCPTFFCETNKTLKPPSDESILVIPVSYISCVFSTEISICSPFLPSQSGRNKKLSFKLQTPPTEPHPSQVVVPREAAMSRAFFKSNNFLRCARRPVDTL